ncbi:MAG: hypothetical protein RBU25_13130, partial [Lentisphaeria bacterium]|nr:hypothetical protein [Lentisphaeria bacterium]
MTTSTHPANAAPRIAGNHLLLALGFLLACLCPAICPADGTYWTGQEVTNVVVSSLGEDGERLLVLPDDPPLVLSFSAGGSYTIEGEAEEEAEEKSIVETYSWGVGIGEIVAGGGEDDNYVTIRILPGMDADASVSVTYTADPGGSASDSITLFVPNWTPGEPIICEGIQAPEDQAVFAVGEEVALTIDPPTDADVRTAASSETYSDDCVVTWAASAGTFKDGVNTGNSVTWIAPDTGQAVTISATVADKAEVPPREKGTRDDADYTDSITVLVVDISVTIP